LNKEEVAGGWRRLHNEELRYLCTSPNIIQVNKSRSMRWTGNIARFEEMGNACDILVENLEGRGRSEDL
jgi:hypothetical protein